MTNSSMNKGPAIKNNNKKVGVTKASAPNNIKSATVGPGGGGGRKVTGPPGKADRSKNATASRQQVSNGRKKDTDMVMLTQSELDALIGTIGKLVIDTKSAMKFNDAAETREQIISNNVRSSAHEYIHNGVDNSRSAGVTWQDERDARAVSFHNTSVAPVAASHMSLAERKRIEWNREAGDAASGWDPWSDRDTRVPPRDTRVPPRDTRVPPGHEAGRHGGYEPAPLLPGYSSYQQQGFQQRPEAPSSRPQPQFPVALSKAEKKRLQWEQERAEMQQLEGYSPWGRGGGGGGAPIKDSYGNVLTDYNSRREVLESDRDSVRQQQLAYGISAFSADDISTHRGHLAPPQLLYKAQSEPERLVADDSISAVQLPPAAIRSSFAIGVPVPNENRYDEYKQRQNDQWRHDLELQMAEQKKKKEEERRLWKDDPVPPQQAINWAEKTSTLRSVPPGTLAPLSHQPRMDSFQSEPTPRDNIPGLQDTRLSSAPIQLNNSGRGFSDQTTGEVQTTYLRGQNVPLDPKTKQEQEEKRQKYRENQDYLKQQMEEHKRKKQEEKERDMKEDMDDEQRRAYELHQQQQQQLVALTQQLQQQRHPQPMSMSTAANGYNTAQAGQQFIMQQQQPAISKEETERRRQELLVKGLEDAKQQAERDKHERWLQRLIKGGHDVSKLKARFEEKLSPSHTANTQQQVANDYHSKQPSVPTGTARHNGFTVEPDYVPGLELTSHAPLPPIGFHGDGDEYTANRVITPTVYRHQHQQQSQDFGASPKKEFGTQTLHEFSDDVTSRDSEAGIEYRPHANHRDTSRRVRVNSAPKVAGSRGKQSVSDSRYGEPTGQAAKSRQKGQKLGWNYRNPDLKPAVKQSERDPTYEQRRERRMERQRELLAQAAANEAHMPGRYRSPVREVDTAARRSPRNPPPSNVAGNTRNNPPPKRSSPDSSPHRGSSPRRQMEATSRFRKESTSNMASVDGGGGFSHRAPSSPPIPAVKHRMDTDRGLSDDKVPTSADFVPFLRTSEILDPAHADSPMPVSREPTAMVKARRAYQRELNPAKYGQPMEHKTNGQASDRPNSQQGRVLQHLSALKQVLLDKQREMVSVSPLLRENIGSGIFVSPVSDY